MAALWVVELEWPGWTSGDGGGSGGGDVDMGVGRWCWFDRRSKERVVVHRKKAEKMEEEDGQGWS